VTALSKSEKGPRGARMYKNPAIARCCPSLMELPPAPRNRVGWPWSEESTQLPETMPDGRLWPRVTIVTPSYNQGEFIEEAIRSVLLQGYPNLEYIIIDGGSTDRTVDIIRRYEDHLTYWVSEPDQGQSDAINKGWKKSSGEILAWINADDTYCPGAIAAVGGTFLEKNDVVLVSGAANTTDVSGETILFTKRPPDINPYEMLRRSGGVPTQPSVFLRRRVVDEIGFLNTELHYVMDWEFWIRLGLYYRPEQFQKTNKVLSNNRQWPETKTNKGWREICQENRLVLDYIFGTFSGDRALQRIKCIAHSTSYRKQASLARENAAPGLAIKSLFRAWCMAPLAYNPAREFAFLLSVILGKEKTDRLKSWLSIERDRLPDDQVDTGEGSECSEELMLRR